MVRRKRRRRRRRRERKEQLSGGITSDLFKLASESQGFRMAPC